jgi:hypothetical protein
MAVPPLYDHHFARPLDDEPVFVVGLGRSGTTLLRLMLHASPELAMLSETWWGPRVWDRRWGFPMRDPVEPFRTRLVDGWVELLGKEDDFPQDLAAHRAALLAGPADLGLFLADLGRRWAADQGAGRWGEKTPVHVHHLRVLHHVFPALRVVHLVRDPRDVAASLVRAPFAASVDPVGFAVEWRRTLEHADAQVAADPALADAVLQVRYEDLVRTPAEVVEQVAAHVGVPAVPAMLDPQAQAARFSPDQPWMAATHQPISDRSVGRWRDDLAPDDVAVIEGLCADRMAALGYEPSLPADELAAARRVADRLWHGVEADRHEQARATADHVAMHRGTYRDLLETR